MNNWYVDNLSPLDLQFSFKMLSDFWPDGRKEVDLTESVTHSALCPNGFVFSPTTSKGLPFAVLVYSSDAVRFTVKVSPTLRFLLCRGGGNENVGDR